MRHTSERRHRASANFGGTGEVCRFGLPPPVADIRPGRAGFKCQVPGPSPGPRAKNRVQTTLSRTRHERLHSIARLFSRRVGVLRYDRAGGAGGGGHVTARLKNHRLKNQLGPQKGIFYLPASAGGKYRARFIGWCAALPGGPAFSPAAAPPGVTAPLP